MPFRFHDLAVALCLLIETVSPLSAQQIAAHTPTHASTVTVPTIIMTGQTIPPSTISAAEMAYHVALVETRAYDAISLTDKSVPRDSIRQLVSTQALQWAMQLQANPVHGIQLDPAGRITVLAGHERDAERTIAERLATPGLTLNDRAYTYLTAVRAFSTDDLENRLTIAERYLAALDSLGPKAVCWQHTAHRELARVYYALGRSADVARHGTRAIVLLPQMDFIDRIPLYENVQVYAEIIDALTRQPDAHARIQSLNATLIAAAKPSAAVLAQEPFSLWQGRANMAKAQAMIQTSARLGTHGDDIVGNYWVNLPSTGAVHGDTAISMADGHIHVVDFGSYTCPPCLMAITSLQRVQDRYPSVRMISVTWTEGSWSNRLVDADEEAEHLRAYYTGELKIRFPISIWKGAKELTKDGGFLPADGPNLKHYPLVGKPNICVIDGKGIIRRIYIGFGRDTETHLAMLLDFLQRETSTAKIEKSGSPTALSTPKAIVEAIAHS